MHSVIKFNAMKRLLVIFCTMLLTAMTVSATSVVIKVRGVSKPLYYLMQRNVTHKSYIDESGNVTLGGRTFNLNRVEYINITATDATPVPGDVNGDGRLSMADMVLGLEIANGRISNSTLRAIIDTDGDKIISKQEIEALSANIATWQDPNPINKPVKSATKPTGIYVSYPDRFSETKSFDITNCDTLSITQTAVVFKSSQKGVPQQSLTATNYKDNGQLVFADPGRGLVKPHTYINNDYTKETSQWCFKRSAESDHFIIFWENGMTKNSTGNITYSGYTCNVNTLLTNAEKIWKCYVEDLGFLVPGKSTTDKFKIQMYIVKNGWNGEGDTWRADGSGVDGTYYDGKNTIWSKTGMFHCTTRAATARNGHTPAHEIGHTFQYLVSADLGMDYGLNYGFGPNASGGNEWWEDCANWQAYKVYPTMQYSDGEYYEQYLGKHHLNIHHEDTRYTNCFYQDWWCQLHGKNTVGRVWRETKKPEDPSQGYMRIFGLDIEGYAQEMYDAYSHLASIDIDAVRNYGKAKIGNEPQRLVEPSAAIKSKYLNNDESWWAVDPAYCPQNFGYNANPLAVPAAGTQVSVDFKGIAGVPGYRAINVDKAGWRYGLVAYCSDGKRVYSDMQKDVEGSVTMTVPDNCVNMWLVVMGAPTQYWRHAWDDDPSNDEQWPYAVRFHGTKPLGASRTYGEFPDDYARKDTTIVINATLAYSGSDWSNTRVQLDMDAISQALGASTAQLQAAVCGKKTTYPYVRIAGMNADGKTLTETKTISDTDVIFGHWFNKSGNVESALTGNAAIYTKIYHDKYGCYIGQRPGTLVKGTTYIVREAVIYTDKNGTEYRAIMEIHLKIS